MSKPIKVKPGDMKINNSIITMSFLYPLDFPYLLKVFNEAGYESIMPFLKDKEFPPSFNIVDSEKFKLNYYPEKKLLELISDTENIAESFDEIVDIIQKSEYNVLSNLMYCEIIWRVLNVRSEDWKNKLQSISSDFIIEFAQIFNFEKLTVNRIGFTSNSNPLNLNWFAVNINPVNALGENHYSFEIIYRSDNIANFRKFLNSLEDNSKKSIFGDESECK